MSEAMVIQHVAFSNQLHRAKLTSSPKNAICPEVGSIYQATEVFKQPCNIRKYKLTQNKTSKITALVLSEQLQNLSARCKNIIVEIFYKH